MNQLFEMTAADILIIGIVLLAVIIFGVLIYLLKSPKKKKDVTSNYYTAALNYLLSGEKQKAFEKLRETVRYDTSNIDAYIKIGDLLRERGEVERATKIHRGLLVRNALKTLERIEILKSLVQDYDAAKEYDKAIDTCRDLLELTKNELWVQEVQLKLFEKKEDWEKAFETRKRLLHRQGKNNDGILALYKVETGLKLTKESKEHDGRVKFREAIKVDKSCASAYLSLSDSYIRENRLADALSVLKRFIKYVPNLSYLSFDRIKEILFQEGNFGEVESIFNSLLETNPEIDSIRFALADIYARKGNLTKAIELCKDELDRKPDSKLARQYLVQYYAKRNDQKNALNLALELIDDYLNEERQFTCHYCGHTANQPYWHCPQCYEWNSYLE